MNEVKADAEKEKDTAELGTLSGSWFLMNGKSPVQDKIFKVPGVFTSGRVQDPNLDGSPSLAAISSSMSNNKIRHHISDAFGKWRPSHAWPGNINGLVSKVGPTTVNTTIDQEQRADDSPCLS